MDENENTPAITLQNQETAEQSPEPIEHAENLDQALEAVWDKAEKPEPQEEKQQESPELQTEKDENTETLQFPNSWAENMKPHWETLSPELKNYVSQREKEAHGAITQMGQELAGNQPFSELLEASEPLFNRHGMDPKEGIHALLQAQAMLDENPLQGLEAIAENYGINLQQLYANRSAEPMAGEGQNNLAPESQNAAQLQSEVVQLQNQLAQQENLIHANEQRQEEQQLLETEVALQQWAVDKPHFHDLRVQDLMGTLLESGHGETLDEAYQKSCQFFPDIQQAVQQAENQQQQQRQGKEIHAAKTAQTLNLGSKVAGKASNGKAWDDEESLSSLYDEIQNKLN